MRKQPPDDEAQGHYRSAGNAVLAMAGVAFVVGLLMTLLIGPDVGFIDGRSAMALSALMGVVGFAMRTRST